jgi:hypothetical protein
MTSKELADNNLTGMVSNFKFLQDHFPIIYIMLNGARSCINTKWLACWRENFKLSYFIED